MNKGLKEIWNDNKYFFIPYGILLVICLAIKLNFTKTEIYFAVNSRYTAWGDAIAQYVTDLGDGWTTISIIFILLFFSFRKAFLLATSYALTGGILAQSLKFIFDAPRPKLYFQNQLGRIHFVSGTNVLSTHSFPSGHTITAFSTSVVLLYFLKNKKWGLLLFCVAVCVGYSRMYLNQHFFEDVTIGSMLGFAATLVWLYWIDSKKFLHTPVWGRGLLSRREVK